MTPVMALLAALLMNDPAAGSSAAVAAAAPVPQPSAIASPAAIASWLGVSLGEAARDVRAALGRPREIVSANVGDLWRYDVDNGNVTLELVVAGDQVLNIAARIKDGKQSSLADPVGGALGMTAQALQSARGTPLATYDAGTHVAYGESSGIRWFYSLDNGAVTAIEVSKPLPAPLPAQVIGDPGHDGSRLDRALVVKASRQVDATNAELDYLRKIPCANGGIWQVGGQELVPAGGRFFDLLHVTCSTTKSVRDYYFDVTDSFGK